MQTTVTSSGKFLSSSLAGLLVPLHNRAPQEDQNWTVGFHDSIPSTQPSSVNSSWMYEQNHEERFPSTLVPWPWKSCHLCPETMGPHRGPFVQPLSILPPMFSADLTPHCGSGAFFPSTVGAGVPPHPSSAQNSVLLLSDGALLKEWASRTAPSNGSRGAPQGLWPGQSGTRSVSQPCPPRPVSSEDAIMAGSRECHNSASHVARNDTENATFQVKSPN